MFKLLPSETENADNNNLLAVSPHDVKKQLMQIQSEGKVSPYIGFTPATMKKNVYYTNDSAGPFMSGQQVNSTISRIGPLEKGQFMEMQKADNLKNVQIGGFNDEKA
jgi:hypothetical protein